MVIQAIIGSFTSVGCPYAPRVLQMAPPLFKAAADGSITVLQQLLKDGTEVDAKDCDGAQARHIAAAT